MFYRHEDADMLNYTTVAQRLQSCSPPSHTMTLQRVTLPSLRLPRPPGHKGDVSLTSMESNVSTNLQGSIYFCESANDYRSFASITPLCKRVSKQFPRKRVVVWLQVMQPLLSDMSMPVMTPTKSHIVTRF